MSAGGAGYQFALAMYKREPAQPSEGHDNAPPNGRLGAFEVQPDFGPVMQWAVFEAIRRDPARPALLDFDAARIEPCWDRSLGKPYVSGIRAIVVQDGHPALALDVPLEYFRNLAKALSSTLVQKGVLQQGEVFRYLVCAYPCQDEPSSAGADDGARFRVTPVPEQLALDERPLGELLARSSASGEIDGEQMPVFMPRQVLEECAELMKAAGTVETGGVLIGRLHRDIRALGGIASAHTHPAPRELFAEVTAQIPAQHTQQELASLTFTPQTWAAVDAAIELRAGGEIRLGWWHTHPVGHWCTKCPEETRVQCRASGKVSGEFFSLHDVHLHRTAFPGAYCVALVLSDRCARGGGRVWHPHIPPTASRLVWRLYGWHRGMVLFRGFHVLESVEAGSAAALPAQQEGEIDVPIV